MGDVERSTSPPPPPDPACQRQLLASIQKRLSTLEQEVLNAPVTSEDLASAIKHMRANSAPGLDGLTAGFYQTAPARKSAVGLLFKKGSRADPGNYRPISLMQVDVKALSKALTFRLQAFLPQFIHADQKAFVKGRSLHHHVRFLSDMQELITARDDTAYAVFLDFEKAYDRVDWDYMFQVLDKVGCGGAFLDWVQEDLPPAKRLLYQLSVPLWFNCDHLLHYQPVCRNDAGAGMRARNFALVEEPQRTYRRKCAEGFGLRRLWDFLDPSGDWPTEQDFVNTEYNFMCTELQTPDGKTHTVLPGTQLQWRYRMRCTLL
ncbi:TPA: hypothetical protein N0F65_008701 [Lagenidium giganteum]|uniref:Reverse transcriptase domain-containing protein n=1 Tax=Lagenidium giganteum TaxID=4803 RepID=A0AAV2YKW1_9STRA|nr:TPA: hypothetical protein N0F65_008701 [Lagenidium giganteum]